MLKLRSFLAAALCLALAVQPALAAGVEVPGAMSESAPRPTPAALVPGAISALSVPIEFPTVQEPPTLTQGDAAASVAPARSLLPAAEAAAQVARARTPAPARPTTLSAQGRAEFSGLGGQKEGELSERVWRHAEERGFEHEAHLQVWEDEGGASAPLAAASGESKSPVQPDPPAPPKKEQISAYSGRVLGFLSNFLLLQLAVESLALAVPQMTDPLKNGFIALAALASTSYVAYATGSFIGGRLVQRLGLARVYRAVLSLRTVLWSAVAYLFYVHHGAISIPALVAFFSADYLVHSIGRVAERTLQREWFKGSPVASNRFGTLRDFIEYGTVFTTMGTGLIIAAFGFGAIIYTAPVLFAMAAALAIALRSLPNHVSEKGGAPLFEGFRDLLGPNLRTLFWTRLLINNFVYLLYYVTAIAFGVFVAHGDPGQSAAAASVLIGLVGMGANAAAVGNTVISRRIEKKTEGILDPDRKADAQSNLMTAHVSRALKWAALAMLGGWLFVSRTQHGTVGPYLIALAPLLAVAGLAGVAVVAAKAVRASKLFAKETALNAAKWAALGIFGVATLLLKAHVASILIWPVFALSPALVLIGLTGQLALTQLDTLITEKMPEKTKAYVVGADRTLTYFSFAVNYLIWGVLFQVFGTGAFYGLGVYCTLTAAAYLWLSRSLKRGLKK